MTMRVIKYPYSFHSQLGVQQHPFGFFFFWQVVHPRPPSSIVFHETVSLHSFIHVCLLVGIILMLNEALFDFSVKNWLIVFTKN